MLCPLDCSHLLPFLDNDTELQCKYILLHVIVSICMCTYAKYKHTARIDATIPTSSRSHLHVAPWYLLFAIKFLKIFHDTGVYMNRVKDVQSHR